MTETLLHPYHHALEFCDELCEKNKIKIYYREKINIFDFMFVVDENRIQFLKNELSMVFPSHVNLIFVSPKQVLEMNKAIRS